MIEQMTKLNTKSYKGVKDYYPSELRLRAWLFDKWRETCQSFGYEEYDASVLEPLEMYTAKTSEEIVNQQTFSFEDRGGRKVTLRPEMTPTVSRMVAGRRQEFGYPLRLFSIPVCFRYERMQRGRNREFFQLNADIFGVDGAEADIELIQLADAIMNNFGAIDEMYMIKINSRRLIDLILGFADATDKEEIIRLMDRKDKMPAEKFAIELEKYCKNPNTILEFMQSGLDEMSDEIKDSTAWKELNSVLNSLSNIGVEAEFDASVTRGFDYYTGIVFEVFDTNPENNRSMFGGGRYDGLVGEFGAEPVATVGFGMGDATLENFLESNNLVPAIESKIQLVMLPMDLNMVQINKVASELRAKGINIALDYTNRKLEKRFKAAEKLGINKVLIVGEQELADDEYELKDLVSGEQEKLSISKIVEAI